MDKFDKNDIAQMLSSSFIILQVFLLPTTIPNLIESILIIMLSILICGVILYITTKENFLKHLFYGLLIVSILSILVGIILQRNINSILISISISLPAATIIDALKK